MAPILTQFSVIEHNKEALLSMSMGCQKLLDLGGSLGWSYIFCSSPKPSALLPSFQSFVFCSSNNLISKSSLPTAPTFKFPASKGNHTMQAPTRKSVITPQIRHLVVSEPDTDLAKAAYYFIYGTAQARSEYRKILLREQQQSHLEAAKALGMTLSLEDSGYSQHEMIATNIWQGYAHHHWRVEHNPLSREVDRLNAIISSAARRTLIEEVADLVSTSYQNWHGYNLRSINSLPLAEQPLYTFITDRLHCSKNPPLECDWATPEIVPRANHTCNVFCCISWSTFVNVAYKRLEFDTPMYFSTNAIVDAHNSADNHTETDPNSNTNYDADSDTDYETAKESDSDTDDHSDRDIDVTADRFEDLVLEN